MADPWTTAKTPVRAPLAVGVKVPPPYSFRRQANATRRLLPKVAPVRSPRGKPETTHEARRRRADIGHRHHLGAAGFSAAKL